MLSAISSLYDKATQGRKKTVDTIARAMLVSKKAINKG
jgi:hypothetical protein